MLAGQDHPILGDILKNLQDMLETWKDLLVAWEDLVHLFTRLSTYGIKWELKFWPFERQRLDLSLNPPHPLGLGWNQKKEREKDREKYYQVLKKPRKKKEGKKGGDLSFQGWFSAFLEVFKVCA